MPKVGMEPVRRQQLIDATLNSVAELGLHATTINSISKRAGLSSGIISHYFGGKQGLIEATVRYLLTQLKINLLAKTTADNTLSPRERLNLIVESNFAPVQQQHDSTRTWLSFWAQSLHDPALFRLQQVNSRRLRSNLQVSLNTLMPRDKAKQAAELAAGMIDGLWLRCVLSCGEADDFHHAEQLSKSYIDTLIAQFGEQ
ncbi:transcriptional regulator BetI [Pseudoalteromonas ruthenica]|uniref:transcriptional regulator BetI n=1 Tax=Pseudoalteromonas ruthenica TaxID=151081 RepID=UPI00110A8A4D|nr:transcriptional regulator BetI [Pseudoalteromonas ruthenica]TMO46904.1 transcriptional regulator BetI [Pseudoalteromonas ruthenica]TMO49117.1 transcriptional regulator BetI [Pseudoalteromonas ruthenica]